MEGIKNCLGYSVQFYSKIFFYQITGIQGLLIYIDFLTKLVMKNMGKIVKARVLQ